jgi:hypothetical protein
MFLWQTEHHFGTVMQLTYAAMQQLLWYSSNSL